MIFLKFEGSVKSKPILCIQISYCYSVTGPLCKSSPAPHIMEWFKAIYGAHTCQALPVVPSFWLEFPSFLQYKPPSEASSVLPASMKPVLITVLEHGANSPHSSHHTINFRMCWHVFPDWSLRFSFMFSTKRLIRWGSVSHVTISVCLTTHSASSGEWQVWSWDVYCHRLRQSKLNWKPRQSMSKNSYI